MPLDDHVKPWSGDAFRHFPKAASINPLDFSHCGNNAENRWNVIGEQTLYLASSKAVALGEFARHLDTSRSTGVRAGIKPRSVARYSLSLTGVLDLRDFGVCRELGFGIDPESLVRDMERARVVGAFSRAMTRAQGLIVPSMAFIDSYKINYCLVVFVEKLMPNLHSFITSATPDGEFSIT
jgi:RES domain-containing protein